MDPICLGTYPEFGPLGVIILGRVRCVSEGRHAGSCWTHMSLTCPASSVTRLSPSLRDAICSWVPAIGFHTTKAKSPGAGLSLRVIFRDGRLMVQMARISGAGGIGNMIATQRDHNQRWTIDSFYLRLLLLARLGDVSTERAKIGRAGWRPPGDDAAPVVRVLVPLGEVKLREAV